MSAHYPSGGAASSGSGPVVEIGDLLAEQAWIRSLARSLVRDPHAADDVVQETWLAVMRRPPRSGQPLRPWLGQVVRNFARMRRRGESNRRRREESAARREAVPPTTEMVERVEVHRAIADGVVELEEPFRSTVLLRYFEGLSAAEIARRTGIPAGTVRWRLKRGLELLRTRLDTERGGRESWMAAVAALVDRPEASLGVGSLLPLPTTLLAALGIGILALGIAVFGPGLLRSARGPAGGGARAIVAPEVEALAPAASGSSLEVSDPGDARRSAEEPPPVEAVVKGPRALVRARVVDPAGAPLAGVQLFGGGRSATSDDLGQLRLELAPAGPRSLELEARGAGLVPHLERVHVDTGAAVDLGELVLAPGGRVTGRAVGADGHGLAGAEVTVEVLGSRWLGLRHLPLEEARYLGSLLERGSARVAKGVSEPDGRFTVGGVPAGFVRVWVGAKGYFHAYSEPLPVRPGVDNRVGEIALSRPSAAERIEGQVLDPTGRPVPGARVEAARRSLSASFFRDEPFVFEAEAGPDGRFVLALDPAARYDLAAADPEGRWRPALDTPHAAGERDVTLRLAPFETLALEVSGPAPEAVELTLIDARRDRRLEPETAAAQRAGWESDGLRAPYVPFRVRVDAPGFASGWLGPFQPGRVPEQATIELARLQGPAGRVVRAGAPVEGAEVTLRRALAPDQVAVFPGRARGSSPLFAICAPGRPVHRTQTDADGRFALPRAERGDYLLRIEAPGAAPAVLGPLTLFGSEPVPLDVDLGSGGVLEGRVLTRGGEPGVGAVVGVTCGDGRLRTERAGADGAYRFDALAPGRWQVRVLRNETPTLGWGRLASSSELVSASAVHWDCEVTEGATARFDVTLPGGPGGALEGRLTIDGESPGPWHAHLVPLWGDVEPRSSAALDHEGNFVLEVREPGRYALELWNSGYRPLYVLLSDEVFLREGATPWSLDLTSASLSGAGGEPEQTDLEHVWAGGGALQVTTRLECDLEGHFGPVSVPAGVGEIRSNGVLLEQVDLAPREELSLELD